MVTVSLQPYHKGLTLEASQTVSFLRDHGIDVPEGSGKVDISAWLPNFERQNPKDMADQLQEIGGVELTNGDAGYWDWKKEKWK